MVVVNFCGPNPWRGLVCNLPKKKRWVPPPVINNVRFFTTFIKLGHAGIFCSSCCWSNQKQHLTMTMLFLFWTVLNLLRILLGVWHLLYIHLLFFSFFYHPNGTSGSRRLRNPVRPRDHNIFFIFYLHTTSLSHRFIPTQHSCN